MTETKILPLLTWRRSIAESALPSTTKLVAFALSLWMNERGASAYPGADTLAKDTSLSVRAVREHLAELVRLGWLELVERGGLKGERRKANVYRAAVAPMALPLGDGEPSVTHAPGLPVQDDATTPASDDANPCTSVTPSLQDLCKNSGGGARKRAPRRGTRIPETFTVTFEMHAWAQAECPNIDWAHSTKEFVAHWKAESGARASKLNWEQAWRKWLLKDEAQAKRHRSASTAEPRRRVLDDEVLPCPLGLCNGRGWTDETPARPCPHLEAVSA